jgi:hypothetical protein
MPEMNDNQRLQLQEMIKANNVEDQTEIIRQLKHSSILRENIKNMMMIKSRFSDKTDIHRECMATSSFLFQYYTDIYNKILQDEMNYELMDKFLNVLERIENGELDQHEGSFIVGTILKELYIDSALKRGEKLDKEYADTKPKPVEGKNISFTQWKRRGGGGGGSGSKFSL